MCVIIDSYTYGEFIYRAVCGYSTDEERTPTIVNNPDVHGGIVEFEHDSGAA